MKRDTTTIDQAYNNMCKCFIAYAKDSGIKKKEEEHILSLFYQVYIDKKAQVFLSEKLSPFIQYLNENLKATIKGLSGNKKYHEGKALEMTYVHSLKKEEEVYGK